MKKRETKKSCSIVNRKQIYSWLGNSRGVNNMENIDESKSNIAHLVLILFLSAVILGRLTALAEPVLF